MPKTGWKRVGQFLCFVAISSFCIPLEKTYGVPSPAGPDVTQPGIEAPVDLGNLQPTGQTAPDGAEIWGYPPGTSLEGIIEVHVQGGRIVRQVLRPGSDSVGSVSSSFQTLALGQGLVVPYPFITPVPEEGLLEKAQEAWEAGEAHQVDLSAIGQQAFVLTEEAFVGQKDRPGLGFHVKKLLEWIPNVSLTVVAHDPYRAIALSRVYQIPLDRVASPRPGESYEDALRRVAADYQADRKATRLIHIDPIDLGSALLLLPNDIQGWMDAVDRFFWFLGISVPPGNRIHHYIAADLATQFFAE